MPVTGDPEIQATSLSPPGKKPRGRPRLPATESPQQRIDRLQAELQHAQEALKLAEQQRAAIVGAVVVRHARANEDSRRQLAIILRAQVKSRADLAALSDLLVEPSATPSTPPAS